jgi:predicted AAA+ superfamily ATPase
MIGDPTGVGPWFDDYVNTFLKGDLRDLSSIDRLVSFRRLMRSAALRLGQSANWTDLSREVELPQPTVHRYLRLLEASYQLIRVEAYSVARIRRLVKSPRFYWSDTGLALHLSGDLEPRSYHLANFVLGDLLAWRESQVRRPDISHWGTTVGDVVDIVIERKGVPLPLTVKATPTPQVRDARFLLRFLEEYPDKSRSGLLLHTGSEMFWLRSRVLAVPWWMVL